MSLNQTPSSERTQIAFFGIRNAGKSSLVNAFTNQNLSIVSDTKGTTTDPVKKAMELLPIGPVVIIDTPGIDDTGELGNMRIDRTKKVLSYADIAILVTDASSGLSPADDALIEEFKKRNLPYIIACNKSDLLKDMPLPADDHYIYVSALTGLNIHELKEKCAHILKDIPKDKPLVSDLLSEGDIAVLVIPIDKSAPKGRLILPQQMVIRDALEAKALPMMCLTSGLSAALSSLDKKPKMVITDSQAFKEVSEIVPMDIPLTSFSVLMARYKGNLSASLQGAYAIDNLKDNDKVLISEGCTHHRQCEDIGAVKLPKWINEYTGKTPDITLTSGSDFPKDLREYSLIIHCGACMLSPKEAAYRYQKAKEQNIPITNYGTAIAHMNGILKRAVQAVQYG